MLHVTGQPATCQVRCIATRAAAGPCHKWHYTRSYHDLSALASLSLFIQTIHVPHSAILVVLFDF